MSGSLIHLRVDKENVSLVAFLHMTQLATYSKKEIKRALEKKACRVNGHIETFASRVLKVGDRVTFDLNRLNKKPLEVLFEDEDLIAIDKPPFWVVDPMNIHRSLGAPYHMVHRLDKETTGVLLLAKKEEVKQALEGLFFNRQMNKTYVTLVQGDLKKEAGVIEGEIDILTQSGGSKVMGLRQSETSKSAKTEYRVIHQKRDIALLECYPHTGRTHQIRVHLTSIGLSILGDSQYGSAKQMASRMMLHAASLKFIHPIKNEMIHIQSALPLDFTHAMHRWGIEV